MIIITNIPTPYRNYLYNKFYDCKILSEVYYQRKIENGRFWKIDFSSMKFNYYIDNGLYFGRGNFHFHFNPKLLIKVLFKSKDNNLLICLSWHDPNLLILCILKRLNFIKSRFIFWSEASYLTSGSLNDNVFKKLYRKFIYNTKGSIQIRTGLITELTFKKWGISVSKFLDLPNTINEEIYCDTPENLLNRNENSVPVFILVARLNEKIKGVLNFIESIQLTDIKKVQLHIIGDGPDKVILTNYINKNQLENNIFLHGDLTQNKVKEFLCNADVFVLPSFSDPAPLSIIEALAVKLPILISNMCGNKNEVLVEGINGFSFNPFNKNEISITFNKCLDSKESWRRMGEESYKIFNNNFNTNVIVENFKNHLLNLENECD